MDSIDDLPHSHCDKCVMMRCQVKVEKNVSCAMVYCEYDCGSKFHSCKLAEHKLWCPNQKVQCVNALYGCPLLVVRSQLSKHLPVCPASVIHCTMEWNRWPVCSSERQAHVPFKQPNPVIIPEQLDMALALRDQRMLNESLKASKAIRKVLKNSLTQRYPAVPLPYHSAGDHHSAEDGERERSATPPGLQSSICNELYKATQRTTESLSAALQDILSNHNDEHTTNNGATGDSIEEFRSSHGALNSDDAANDYDGATNNTFGSEKWKENVILRTEPPPAGLVSTNMPVRHITHAKPKPTHSYLSIGPNELNIQCAHCRKWRAKLQVIPDLSRDSEAKHDVASALEAKSDLSGDLEARQDEGRDTHQGDRDDIDNDYVKQEECSHKHATDEEAGSSGGRPGMVDFIPIEVAGGITQDTPCSDSSSDLEVPMFATQSMVSDVSAAPARDNSGTRVTNPPTLSFTAPPIPPLPPTDGNQTLGLDLTLEAITRYQPKPKSMYTFLCNQEFRRDEFPHHFQNVHSEIHGGLNGWIEQRCPLASYGCTFSERRLYPGSKDAHIIHDRDLASFGIKPDLSSKTKTNGHAGGDGDHQHDIHGKTTDLFSALPFELLLHICRFLDSFSLCNLSMVSRFMREVCCALLEDRGIVIQHWRRTKYGDRYSWNIAYQVWQFSTSFSSVSSWGFDDIPAIAEHLKTCPFNNKLIRTEPFRVISVSSLEPLQESVSETTP
ncbi:F-box only protein 30-like [Glandiceps talaboti]